MNVTGGRPGLLMHSRHYRQFADGMASLLRRRGRQDALMPLDCHGAHQGRRIFMFDLALQVLRQNRTNSTIRKRFCQRR